MSRSSTSPAYLIQETLLFLGLTFLLILNGTTRNLINPTLQVGLAVMFSLAGAAWLIAGQRGRTPAGRALLVWLAVYVVVVIFSIDARRSLSQMLLMSTSVFLFALSADLAARGWPRELFVKALLMVGVVILLLGLMEALLWYQRWLQTSPGQWIPDILYRPGSANVIAMFLNLLLMLAGARLLVTRSRVGRIVLIILILPAMWLLYLTSSRGGWLGTAAGLSMLALLALVSGRVEWRKGWAFLRARPALLAGAVLVGLLVLGAGGALLYQRTLHPSHGPIALSRADYWPPAWQAFLSSPLVGTGPFTYSNAFLSHNSTPPWYLFIHAHGTPFNLLAEMGLLGAVGMLLLVGSIARSLWQQVRVSQGEDLGVVTGAAAAVAAVGVHSLFDCFHTEPIGLWALCIILGAALGQRAVPGRSESRPRLGRWNNAWVLLVVGALWIEIWMAAPLHRGVELANSGDWQAAAQAFNQAVQRDPASVIAYQQRALANSILARRDVPAALQQAIRDLEEVVRREPGWSLNAANLGALYLADGRPAEARQALEEALRRAPDCAICALNLGVACEAAGDPSAAVPAYQRALDLGQPVDAYFWRSSTLRVQARADWLLDHPRPAWVEADLRAELARNPSAANSYLALAEMALQSNQLDEAEALLSKAALAYVDFPINGMQREWLAAELLARRGNLEAAIQMGSGIFASYQLYGLYGPGSLGQLSYAPLMFRRPAMALELTPQLELILLPDDWGQHMASLAEWMEQAGQQQAAADLRQELLKKIPDFSLP